MAEKPTQNERVLRALRRQGRFGITPIDFVRTPTIDGHPPILRLAARIGELRAEGHRISTDVGTTALYRLHEASPGAPDARPAGEEAAGPLPGQAPSSPGEDQLHFGEAA